MGKLPEAATSTMSDRTVKKNYSCIDLMADEGLMPSVKQGGSKS